MNIPLPPYSRNAWKIIAGCVIGLVALGAILWAVSGIKTAYQNRQITKARQGVNVAAKELKDAQGAVNADRTDVAIKTEILKEKVQNAVDAISATDEQKAVVNQATANLANAVAANRPVGTTPAEIEKMLDDLGVK